VRHRGPQRDRSTADHDQVCASNYVRHSGVMEQAPLGAFTPTSPPSLGGLPQWTTCRTGSSSRTKLSLRDEITATIGDPRASRGGKLATVARRTSATAHSPERISRRQADVGRGHPHIRRMAETTPNPLNAVQMFARRRMKATAAVVMCRGPTSAHKSTLRSRVYLKSTRSGRPAVRLRNEVAQYVCGRWRRRLVATVYAARDAFRKSPAGNHRTRRRQRYPTAGQKTERAAEVCNMAERGSAPDRRAGEAQSPDVGDPRSTPVPVNTDGGLIAKRRRTDRLRPALRHVHDDRAVQLRLSGRVYRHVAPVTLRHESGNAQFPTVDAPGTPRLLRSSPSVRVSSLPTRSAGSYSNHSKAAHAADRVDADYAPDESSAPAHFRGEDGAKNLPNSASTSNFFVLIPLPRGETVSGPWGCIASRLRAPPDSMAARSPPTIEVHRPMHARCDDPVSTTQRLLRSVRPSSIARRSGPRTMSASTSVRTRTLVFCFPGADEGRSALQRSASSRPASATRPSVRAVATLRAWAATYADPARGQRRSRSHHKRSSLTVRGRPGRTARHVYRDHRPATTRATRDPSSFARKLRLAPEHVELGVHPA